jgi:hypothetical protein
VKLDGILDAALPLVLVIALTAACCRQSVRPIGPPPAERSWCTSWSARTPEGPVEGDACVDRRESCERAVARARKWGGVAGITSVGDCAWRGGR